MKKITLLSLVAVTLVFTACGEDTKVSEAATKAKAERVIELEKMAANKIAAKAAEKEEVAQIRAAKKAAAKAEKEAAAMAKREQEAKVAAAKVEQEAAEKALKEINTTEVPVTDASIVEAANKEIKVSP